MGFVAAINNKIYLVGGKISAWTTGASQYSWSDSAELDSEYSKDKGNDDLWELNYQADPPTWTKRVQSLYATVCNAEWTSGSASATFCENFLGQCHTCTVRNRSLETGPNRNLLDQSLSFSQKNRN